MLGQQPLPNLGNRCLSIGQPLPNNWATFAQPWASVAQYLGNGCPIPGLDNGCEYLGNGCPTLGQRLLTYWANFVHARTVDKILGTMCQNKTGHGPHLDSFHTISLPTCASVAGAGLGAALAAAAAAGTAGDALAIAAADA